MITCWAYGGTLLISSRSWSIDRPSGIAAEAQPDGGHVCMEGFRVKLEKRHLVRLRGVEGQIRRAKGGRLGIKKGVVDVPDTKSGI